MAPARGRLQGSQGALHRRVPRRQGLRCPQLVPGAFAWRCQPITARLRLPGLGQQGRHACSKTAGVARGLRQPRSPQPCLQQLAPGCSQLWMLGRQRTRERQQVLAAREIEVAGCSACECGESFDDLARAGRGQAVDMGAKFAA